ncbi:MAG: hypothetical protein HY556_04005 [Euryarchaeota archaeon]|nr:hypothetical protein [Euryarchaeota archaeon]
MEPTVEITAGAMELIHKVSADRGQTASPRLRLVVVGSGCMGGRGHHYALSLAREAIPGEHVLHSGGIEVRIDKESIVKLGRVRLDRVDTTGNPFLRVVNSKATGKCPCGVHDLFE